jgi:iron complex outermembrane recepter protein
MKFNAPQFFAASLLCWVAGPLGSFAQSQAPTTPTSTVAQPTPTPTPVPSTAPAETSTSSSSSGPITKLEAFTVNDVPLEEQILPTVRPVGSVMGDPENIVDIPRSVTTIDSAWMADRQVKNSMDLGQFSPGVYSPANYGEPAAAQIRGDFAQYYVNGQQIIFNAESVLPSFNGVQGMDIVKGPGSAVYGPQGQGPGGYVNLVTAQPYFDRNRTEIDATFGSWASGHAYFNPEFTIDNGGPITPDLAYRVSYLSRYGDGYYENDPNRTQDVFAALTYNATSKLKFEWWGHWYHNDVIDTSGVNRVTQQFIDHGIYIGGSVTAYPDTPPYGFGNVDGSFGLLNPATAYTVKLTQRAVMSSPSDYGWSNRYQTQLVTTLLLGSDISLINRSYFEYLDEEQYNYFGYTNSIPKQESAQDRFEYHQDFSVGGVGNTLIGGADFRFSRLLSYENFAVEPFFYYNLDTPSATNLRFPALTEIPTLGAEYAIPGEPGEGAYLAGDSSNQDSYIYDSALFVQDNIKWNTYLSTIIGLRVDDVEGNDNSPPLYMVGNPVTGQYNGYTGPYLAPGAIFEASDRVYDPSIFGSLVVKLTDHSSVYVTYNRVDAVIGGGLGGVNVSEITDGANTPIGTPAEYHQQIDAGFRTISTLYEAGYKQSLLGNALYVAADIYQQTKSETQPQGPPYQVKAQGLEAEFVYQPSKAFTLNGNFTYQNVTDFGSAFFQQTYSYLDGYPQGFIVDGVSGTGNGSPNYGEYSPPGDRMKAPGMPQVLANVFMEYKLKSGYGFGLGPQIQGKQYADDQDALHIPTEYELDGYLFYRSKTWDCQVNIRNITNRRNLDPVDVTFSGNDLIWVREPVRASITFRFHL